MIATCVRAPGWCAPVQAVLELGQEAIHLTGDRGDGAQLPERKRGHHQTLLAVLLPSGVAALLPVLLVLPLPPCWGSLLVGSKSRENRKRNKIWRENAPRPSGPISAGPAG
jgi:hypothetical protein